MGCPNLTYHLTAEPRLRCVYNAADGQESYAFERKSKFFSSSIPFMEIFGYDNLDRLTSVHHGSTSGVLNMSLNYHEAN